MPADQRVITRADILPMTDYAKQRAERRRTILPLKRLRRLSVGPYATFYFECYETMWLQVHEMLYIEKGGEDQIPDELRAYNPLIPQKGELVATLMFEIEDERRRTQILRTLTNVEETVFFDVGGARVKATFETDVERTAEDGKTSSVHFLRFAFPPALVAKFKDPAVPVVLGLSHTNYAHMTQIQPDARAELVKDLG